VGGGGGLAGVVVAKERQHAAVGGGTREVGVAQGVSRAVHPRSLAVPDPEHPVVVALAQARLLAAPHRGGGQILVHRRLHADTLPGQ